MSKIKLLKKNGFMDDFLFKVFLTGLIIVGLFYVFLRFITYDANTIRKQISKLDSEAILISGQILDWKLFTDLKGCGAYNVMTLKTRNGTILVATLKDKPTIKGNYFFEVEVIGSIETVNRRFKPNTPLRKGDSINKSIPFLLEKSRIRLPFMI